MFQILLWRIFSIELIQKLRILFKTIPKMWKRIMLVTIACLHSTYVKIWRGLKSFYFREQLIIDFNCKLLKWCIDLDLCSKKFQFSHFPKNGFICFKYTRQAHMQSTKCKGSFQANQETATMFGLTLVLIGHELLESCGADRQRTLPDQ